MKFKLSLIIYPIKFFVVELYSKENPHPFHEMKRDK